MQTMRSISVGLTLGQREVRRIQARSALALAVLVGIWLFICAFVLMAIWMEWNL
jgi:hypothetical protein